MGRMLVTYHYYTVNYLASFLYWLCIGKWEALLLAVATINEQRLSITDLTLDEHLKQELLLQAV